MTTAGTSIDRRISEPVATPTLTYIPSLDGLRALAVLLVVVHHAFGTTTLFATDYGQFLNQLKFTVVRNAWCGVELFTAAAFEWLKQRGVEQWEGKMHVTNNGVNRLYQKPGCQTVLSFHTFHRNNEIKA